eukprot:2258808-Alexandrium_andersonii.AAC.1
MRQIPKPEGGHRLVGVLHVLARVWARLRFSLVRQWDQWHQSRVFWAGRGRSSVMCAYSHDLAAEVATARGGHSASVFLDLKK